MEVLAKGLARGILSVLSVTTVGMIPFVGLVQDLASKVVMTEPVLSARYDTPIQVSRHDSHPLVLHHHWRALSEGTPCRPFPMQ